MYNQEHKIGRNFWGKLTIIILRVVHFLFLFIGAFCAEELVFLAFFSTAVDNGLFERFPPGKQTERILLIMAKHGETDIFSMKTRHRLLNIGCDAPHTVRATLDLAQIGVHNRDIAINLFSKIQLFATRIFLHICNELFSQI